MCGIGGIVSLQPGRGTPPRASLLAMAGALRHRGPDESGLYRAPGAGLVHTRLAVVDVASGQQPLCSHDGTRWIVFNGEIFNHVELRAELERAGRRFCTRSDTEVIVQAHDAWGEEAFRRFNGQWAVALWDERRRRLTLARDPLGIQPLYLCRYRGRLYFASEVKALFAADPSIPRALDPLGLDEAFTFWTPLPPRTVFRGVEELPPGRLRVYQDGAVRELDLCRARVTGPVAAPPPATLEDAARAVRETLRQATRLRVIRADVPVGSYLSGGLDSALVAALGCRFAGRRFQTFSVRFEDPEYDETPFQRLMAARLGSEHHEVLVRRADIARVFPDVIRHAERPVLRSAPAPLFLLSRCVSRHGIKVVLTGEGADEVFAGYDLFREGKVRRFWARFPDSRLRPRALERLYPYLARSPVTRRALARQFFGRDLAAWREPGFAHQTRWRTTGALKRLFSPALRAELAGRNAVREFLASLPEGFSGWAPLTQDQYIETRTLLSGYLLSAQGDRMLMAHSVEGRFPFLDDGVMRLADALPPAWKLRALDEKHVLKRAAAGLVPEEIIRRSKQPYRAPDASSFCVPEAPDYVGELLSAGAVADAGLFDPGSVAGLYGKVRAAGRAPCSNSDNMALLGVLSTQLLHHHLVRGRPAPHEDIRLRVDVDRLAPRQTACPETGT